jgi:NADH-quinone oxidoreductase subunit H
MMQDLVVHLVFIGYALAVLLLFGTVLTWVERKQAAIMSDRIGANRAYVRIPFTQVKLVWWGLFHGLADGLKMMLKEDFRPNSYDRFAYALAPWVAFTPVLLVFSVIPFGGTLVPAKLLPDASALAAWFGDRTYSMQIASVDAGLLVVFAFGGLTIIGAMLAGWSSSNKFSLLGALRAGSQMISYELIMALTVLGLILIYGTVDLNAIARQQSGVMLGFLPAWGIFLQPFAAILFLTAAIAENKRIPFDLPEAESELIAGYHTEYSAMKFSMFFIAEYANMLTASALLVTLFFGGWDVFPGLAFSAPPWSVTKSIVTFFAFWTKTLFFYLLYIWIRWTLPRFRFDQLMDLGWKFMLPLALANVMVIAVASWGLVAGGIGLGHKGALALAGMNVVLGAVLFFWYDRGRVMGGAAMRARRTMRADTVSHLGGH